LKTRNLLILPVAQNAENGEIALNWNVSGTRDFSFAKRNLGYSVAFFPGIGDYTSRTSTLPTTPFLDNFRVADNPGVIARWLESRS